MNTALHKIAGLEKQLRDLQPEAVATRKAEAVEKLEKLQAATDPEAAHAQADQVLCEFLRAIGHREVADEFDAVERWYG